MPPPIATAPDRGNAATSSPGPRRETLQTWQRQRQAAFAPRSTRRVDWPLVVGRGLRLPLCQVPTPPKDALSVLAATDELSRYRDENTLLRRAVELARSRLGVERAAAGEDGGAVNLLHGTWGTGIQGETTDEREIAFVMGGTHREAITRATAGAGRWLLLDHAPLTSQVDGKTRIVGHGWNALTPIRSARGLLGLFVNDAAITGSGVDDNRQAHVALYCTMLGNLVELLRTERKTLVPPSTSIATPEARTSAPDASAEVAARVVALLEEDSTLGRRELSSRLGVSQSCLSRAFKSQMGLSVSQYKSRLKLERFFVLVDRRERNLLSAALDAGFGSYAQFHRVFRSVLGKTPSEYLAQR